MCGRFTQTFDETIFDYFPVSNHSELAIQATFNAAPSQAVLAVAGKEGQYKAGQLHWGLVPFWSKSKKGTGIINARAETVAEKPSFRHLIGSKRCLILADSFYEWERTDKGKVPFRFMLQSEQPFAFAGLWDRWQANGKELITCTIITTEANQLVREVHDRMPVMLDASAAYHWLDDAPDEALGRLLPYDSEKMMKYEVTAKVNSPAYNEAECTQPV
ncbi:SOS response-associated peptidase [Metabacillus sp. 84]|uniref:SOS response-associated peptidase n=1 Tax=unclassified Metabacillus TaxID=2675274 RepID=UPI003CEA8D84